MAMWKICRHQYGNEEFTFQEGEVISVGRGFDNKITLSSIVVSRNHCVIKVQKDDVLITDLKSSNGTYVGAKKIPTNSEFTAKDGDIIGFGWTQDGVFGNITDNDKHVFKLVRLKCRESIANRIQYVSDSDDNLENNIAAIDGLIKQETESKTLKRKSCDPIDTLHVKVKKESKEQNENIPMQDENIINLLSDSDNEVDKKEKNNNIHVNNIKLDPILEEPLNPCIKEENIKTENDIPDYEAFEVKQEYLGFDDNELIQIDSDSDSESEQWMLRLSQSSPGKPFVRHSQSQVVPQQENTSYSQIEEPAMELDNEIHNEEEFYDDIISIPPQQQKVDYDNVDDNEINDVALANHDTDGEEIINDLISFNIPTTSKTIDTAKDESVDSVDGSSAAPPKLVVENQHETMKKAQMIEPLVQLPKRKAHAASTEYKSKVPSSKASFTKTSSSSKSSKSSKQSSRTVTDTLKEERKKKLKELANKDKEDSGHKSNKSDPQQNKPKVHAKVSSSNRGAFLTAQAVVKPVSTKESPEKPHKPKEKKRDTMHKSSQEPGPSTVNDTDNAKKVNKNRSSVESDKIKDKSSRRGSVKKDARIPLKSVKPLSESEDKGKPISKVDPLPPKKDEMDKKSVRFSDAPPEVRVFEIEPGNKLNKTSSIKTRQVDMRQMPVFSLEKLTLMKILRWNPHWLDEQVNNPTPPPILGHSNPPLAKFQAFESHNQYVGQVGDLLLMEIWECISQGYMKLRHQNSGIPMKILYIPLAPPQDRCYDLFHLSVEIPKSEMRDMPRMGEIMIIYFGPEQARNSRFVYVTNVQSPNNRHQHFVVNLHATYTEKMKSLHPGETIAGKRLAHIHKELTLFEAMEYLADSPLCESILRPEPRHFPDRVHNEECSMYSQWTKDLNDCQKTAVSASVSAALGDRPSIQMVQGPPGTGKSSVICAMVMAYFYDGMGRRLQNRAKILICATSNAAVDELVIRLLNIRQNLPKTERFRMIRVGRAEAMHQRAREVSSQTLAQRDARQCADQNTAPALREEVSRLTAKINMWKAMMRDAKDPARAATCETRIKQFMDKRALSLKKTSGKTLVLQQRTTQSEGSTGKVYEKCLNWPHESHDAFGPSQSDCDIIRTDIRKVKLGGAGGTGGNEEPRAEDIARAERRLIDNADIVLTTLASAINPKMRGLKHRIALCIVDEAGQATEPEVLIPLTLDVTRLALIGDPQQLPGYICSQRARDHGLGESLFARLSDASEGWARGAVVLLRRQYRMHREIANYPDRSFYGGRLQHAPPSRPNLPFPPYALLDVASGDKGQGVNGGNEMEAWGVARVVAALRQLARKLQLSLAVITPYNAQKDLIKRNLRSLLDPNEQAVEVNTVDSFQGQERDIVVVSLARSSGVGFLAETGRMNVMLTRARHALLIALNRQAVTGNKQWKTLVRDAEERGVMRALPNKMCQPLAPGQSVEEILQYIK